ncbi:MAG: hypothetical protein K0U16_07830 [Gammaproteobacteria bacterium]|nr:hypothetical protein [Gammaproteobacteria bacterium]
MVRLKRHGSDDPEAQPNSVSRNLFQVLFPSLFPETVHPTSISRGQDGPVGVVTQMHAIDCPKAAEIRPEHSCPPQEGHQAGHRGLVVRPERRPRWHLR